METLRGDVANGLDRSVTAAALYQTPRHCAVGEIDGGLLCGQNSANAQDLALDRRGRDEGLIAYGRTATAQG